MTPGGTITRKDLIDDDALNYGTELVKKLLPAIEAQDKLVESAKGYSAVISSMKKAESQQAFLEEKQKERILYEKTTNAIKLEQTTLKEVEKVKQEAIKTRKLELDALAKEERAKRGTVKLTIEERVQNEANNRILRQEVRERLGLVSAYDKLNKARTDAKNKLRDLIATEGTSTAEIKKAQKEYDVLAAKVKKADDAVNDFTKNVGNYPTIGKLAGSVRELFGAFGLAAGIGAAAAILKGAYDTIVKFDQGIADLGAITGASGKDLEYLKNQAIDLGKQTKGGAVQVVEAYKLIASAKPELLENVENLNQVTKAVLTLSKASGLELPDAATALTDAMNQFGAPAEEAGIFIDALANGAKYGAAEIPQVTEALLKFGAVSRKAGVDIHESVAMIELLAEKGIKGAEGGTALRNVMLKLTEVNALPKKAFEEVANALEKSGKSMDFLTDKSIPFEQKLQALKPILEKNGALTKVFGIENAVAGQILIENSSTLKDSTEKIREYGGAQEQASIRTDTLQGKTERLSASYDSFILSLNSGKGSVSIFLGEVVELFDFMLGGLERMNTSWDELNKKAAESGKSSGLELFQKQFQSLRKNGVSDMEALTSVLGQARLDIVKIDKELKDARKNDTVSDSESTARAILGLPSGRDAKVEVERLTARRAELLAIIKQANTKIAQENNKQTAKEKEKTNTIIALSKEELKEIEKAEKKREQARRDELAKMKKADDDEFALWKFHKEQEIKISDEITVNDKESIDSRIDALLNGNKKEEELIVGITAKKLREHSRYNDEIIDLTDEQINILTKASDEELELLYKNLEIKSAINGSTRKLSNTEILALEELRAKKRDIKLKEVDDAQKIADAIVEIENKKIDRILKNKDTELNNKLSKENEFFKEELEALKGNQEAIEDATKDHEARVLKIKKEAIEEGLRLEIEATKKLLENSNLSANVKSDLLNKLSKLELELNQIAVDSTTDKNEKKTLSEKEYSERIKEMSQELAHSLADLTNALFDARIQRIDEDIQKNDEYYSEQIRLAGDDQRQKDLLTIESEKKRKELEDKKRKEQQKQAIFNKALNIAEIGFKTAQAVVAALAIGPPQGFVLAALAGAIGVAQLATVIATPIPKYEKGTKNHGGGLAEVGEKRPEVIMEPGKNPYIVTNPQILNLAKGTQVIPSLEQYQKQFGQDSIDGMLKGSQGKINDYNYLYQLNFNSKEMIDEMRLTRKAIEKNKPQRPIIQKGIDIPHSIWASKNINW